MYEFLRESAQRLLKETISSLSLPSGHPNICSRRMVLLIDRSESMSTADMKTTRLAAAQKAAIELVLENFDHVDPSVISVISFSGDAIMHHPFLPTQSLKSIKSAINSVHLDGPTSIGAGLDLATRAMPKSPIGDTSIVLLSDGCDNGSVDPRAVARKLKSWGCTIYTRGIGKQSEVDEDLLRDIASLGADGKPQYMFHSEETSLVKDFVAIGRLTR